MSQNTHNVRTRREQLATYPESVCVGRYSGDTWQLELDGDDLDADRLVEGPVLYVRCDIAHRSQIEAEARGAAEQRRKDAEGQEPIAWLVEQRGVDSPFFTQNKLAIESQFITGITPLYTRPANVAALEARVKELEDQERKDAQVIHWLAEKLKDADPSAATDCELIARAALTREGGV